MRVETAMLRQWSILITLSARRLGATVRELAADAGVTEKTIRRDLNHLRVGFPIEEEVGEFGRKTFRITDSGKLPPLRFSLDEAVALYLGRRLMEPLAGTPVWDAAQNAFRKIQATLGPTAREYLARFGMLFHQTAVGRHDYGARTEVIDDLQFAATELRVTRILYRSEGAAEPVYRDLHPYGLIHHRAALYLVARDRDVEKVKHYKIDRIEDVEVGPAFFRRPPDFDLGDHLRSTFGVYHRDGAAVLVKVRFAPSAARYVQESEWQKGQQLSTQRDGGLLAEFRVSCTEELKSWVLGFGKKAVVLEPESLRAEIAEELRELTLAYSSVPEFRPAVAAEPHPHAGRRGR